MTDGLIGKEMKEYSDVRGIDDEWVEEEIDYVDFVLSPFLGPWEGTLNLLASISINCYGIAFDKIRTNRDPLFYSVLLLVI